MIRSVYKITFFLLLSGSIFSQSEICNNCIDDDGNGLVDCYDDDCILDISCKDFYLSLETDTHTVCRSTIQYAPEYLLIEKWRNKNKGSGFQTIVVGDIDNDNVPEVIACDNHVKKIYIIDGVTGALESTIDIPFTYTDGLGADGLAIADVDGDGYGEIFYHGIYDQNFPNYPTRLLRFEHDATNPTWETVNLYTGDFYARHYYPNVADFNGDGTAEIYIGNKIINTIDGTVIVSGIGSEGKGFSVAADILDSSATCPECSGLELVAGNQVYGIDIATNSINVRATAPAPFLDGFTSVADFDLDGKLDVIVSQGINGASMGVFVYVWNPRTQDSIGKRYNTKSAFIGGRPNIDNFDQDPEPEIGVAGDQLYIMIDNDMSEKWRQFTNDISSSQFTGATSSMSFDFDCDGINEIVYRDAFLLYIFDGLTGNIKNETVCLSGTWNENPTIVDIDTDGHADIICECGNWPSASDIVVFSSINNDWAHTRQVMNQTTYYNTHINDDLTVPCIQQNHANLLAGQAGASRPDLNGFMKQSKSYDKEGNPICYYSIPDATIEIIQADSLIDCQTLNIKVKICNVGPETTVIPIGTKISIYKDEPHNGGSLITTYAINKAIESDSCMIFDISISLGNYVLYAYVNDDGSDPLNAPSLNIKECDSANNLSILDNISNLSPFVLEDTSVCLGQFIELIVEQGYSYHWSPTEGLSDTSVFNPVVEPNKNITYYIEIVDSINCVYTDSIYLEVKSCTLPFIPNSFTPGSDNLNSVLYVRANNPMKYEFIIYNVYGKKIFESHNISEGWNGQIGNINAPEGVYLYNLKLATDNNIPYQYKGNIFLIR